MHKNGISLALALLAAGLLAGCGGSGAVQTSGGGTPTNKSAAVVTAGDAPMSSVLAAVVTVSSVTFASDSGSVPLLSQPTQIELTHLGGIRAPLALASLAAGTYTSMNLTVSAATITYIDSTTGKPVTAQATIPASAATATVTFNPALVVSSSSATDVRFDFDLQKSLDLTGSTVTFTPVIAGAAASVQSESSAGRRVHVDGTISAVSTTANTVTLTTEAGLSVTLNVNQNTQFDDNLALSSLKTGEEVQTVDTIGVDGALTAVVIEDADADTAEGEQGQVDGGIVTSVARDSQNQLTSFTLVVRNSLQLDTLGQTLTVEVNSGTVFKDNWMATTAGLASFDQSSIFAGQGVWVAGTTVQTASNTVLAVYVRPAAVSPYGLTNSAVQANASGGFNIGLLLDTQTNFAQFANLTTLAVQTNGQTVLDGNGLTTDSLANLAVGTPLIARGYLGASGSSDVLFCTHLFEESR